MNPFRKLASSVRKTVFSSSVRQQTRKLDPTLRSAAVQDMLEDDPGVHQDLEQVETELERAKEALAASESKETFLSQRYRQYRKALDARAAALKEEQKALAQRREHEIADDTDEETLGAFRMEEQDLETRMEKWERDEDSLASVQATHKQIMAQCETMRRQIRDLEQKRNSIRRMVVEHTDFLEAAAEATVAESTDLDLVENGEEQAETEMRGLEAQAEEGESGSGNSAEVPEDPAVQPSDGNPETSENSKDETAVSDPGPDPIGPIGIELADGGVIAL